MLQRPKYAHYGQGTVLALAVGSQTVHLWRSALGAEDDFDIEVSHRTPDLIIEVPGSPLAGLVFVDETTLVTVHSHGEVQALDLDALSATGPASGPASGQAPGQRWQANFRTTITAFAAHRCARDERLWIALGNESGHIFLLELRRDEKPRQARGRGHRDAVICLAFSGDDLRMASSARDRSIQIWATDLDFETAHGTQELRALCKLEGAGGWPLAMAFSHDHQRLVSGGMDNGIYLWDLQAPRALQFVSQEHHGWVNDVAFFEDDRRIASASWDNSVGVFDVDRLKPLMRLNLHKDYVSSLLLVEGGARLLAAGYDGQISAWDVNEGVLEQAIQAHADWIIELAMVGKGRFISLASDRSLSLWSIEGLRCLGVFGEQPSLNFQIGGSMGWKDFGLGGVSVVTDSSRSTMGDELMQAQAVRRYNKEEQENAAGKQHTAEELLEDISNRTAWLYAGDDEVEPGEEKGITEAWLGGEQASHGEPVALIVVDRDVEEEAGADLSSLVLDAISESEVRRLPSFPNRVVKPEIVEDEEVEEVSEQEGADEEEDEEEEVEREEEAPIDIMDPLFDSPSSEQSFREEDDEPESSPPSPSVLVLAPIYASEPIESSPLASSSLESSPSEDNVDALDEPIPIEGAMDVSEWVPDEKEFDHAFSDSLSSEVASEVALASPVEDVPRPDSLASRLKARREELQERLAKVVPIQARLEPLDVDDEPVEVPIEMPGMGAQTTDVGFQTAGRPLVKQGDDKEIADEDATRELNLSSLGFGRLAPGKIDALEVPLPTGHEFVSEPESVPNLVTGSDGAEALSVIEISSTELWDRSATSTAGMGIMKRKLPLKAEYKPLLQMRTGHVSDLRIGLCAKEKRLVSGARDGSVCIWDVATGERTLRFGIDPRGVGSVGFLSDSHVVYALGRDRLVNFWLLPRASSGRDARPMHTSLSGHEDAITCGVVHPRNKHLLTGSLDGTARLWSLQDGQCVAVLAGQNTPVVGVTYGNKGPITASEDGKIRIWNQQGFQIDQIESVGELTAIDSRGGMLCWAQASGAVHSMGEGESKSRRLWGHYGEARSVSFRPDGCFATAGEDGRILIYCGDEDRPFQEIQLPAPISCVNLGDRVLAVACEGGVIYVFKRAQ